MARQSSNQAMPFRQAQGPELADGQRAPKAFASRLAGSHGKEEVRFMKDENGSHAPPTPASLREALRAGRQQSLILLMNSRDSLIFSLPFSQRYPRGYSVYPVATQHTVFNLRS